MPKSSRTGTQKGTLQETGLVAVPNTTHMARPTAAARVEPARRQSTPMSVTVRKHRKRSRRQACWEKPAWLLALAAVLGALTGLAQALHLHF